MAVAITRPGGDIAGVAASGNVATYTDTNIGAAADDRIVVVCVGTELTSSVPTACTIGGVAATAGVAATQGAVTSHIFYLRVPSGTTATVTVTFGGTNPTAAQNHIAVYRVVGAGLPVFAASSVADTDADPITTGSQTIPTSGGGIFICSDATDTTARTWTGAAEDLDVDAGDFRFSTGTSTTAGALTTTVSGGNNEDGAISWVFFGLNNTLTASLFAEADEFFTQVVTATYSLSPSLFDDTDTFFSPTVEQPGGVQNLDPSLFTDTDAFFSPTVLSVYALTPSLFTDTDEFFTQTVTPGAVDLAPALYTDTDAFNTQTLTATYGLVPSLFTDADAFFSPTVLSVYGLAPSLFTDADAFFTQTVTPGAVDLAPALFADADSFFTQTVSPGAVNLAAALFDEGDTFFSPTVAQDGGTQNLAPALYTDTDAFNAHTLTATYDLAPSLFAEADNFFSATVLASYGLSPALFSDTDVFFTQQALGGDIPVNRVPTKLRAGQDLIRPRHFGGRPGVGAGGRPKG